MRPAGGHEDRDPDPEQQRFRDLSLQDLREKRARDKALGDGVSYLRRLTQGRLDIVLHEVERRDAGESPATLSELVASLPETLGHRVVGRGPSRLTRAEQIHDPALAAELDAVCPPSVLTHLPELGADELHRLVDALTALEADFSGRRRAVYDELDKLSSELARRYHDGETSVDDLLEDEGDP